MTLNQTKHETVLTLLDTQWISVVVDRRADPHVCFPAWLAPVNKFLIGYNTPNPIPDLHINEYGIRATLSFDRRGYACWFPWEAVIAVQGENTGLFLWPTTADMGELPEPLRPTKPRKPTSARTPPPRKPTSGVHSFESAFKETHADRAFSPSPRIQHKPKLRLIQGGKTS